MPGEDWEQPRELLPGAKRAKSLKMCDGTVCAYPESASLVWIFRQDPVISALSQPIFYTLL